MQAFKDTHKRSIVKSIIWRAVSIFILATISWLVTHNWKTMPLITVTFHGIFVVLYYLYERIWEKISWGRIEHPLSGLPVKNNLKAEDLQIIRRKLEELNYLD